MIFLIADISDAHADVVEKILRNMRQRYFRLNLDVASLRSTSISFDGTVWYVETSQSSVNSLEIKAVWARRLTVNLDLDQQIHGGDVDFQLWRAEWNRTLYGLYFCIRECFWINPIYEAYLADNKFRQIKLAEEVGFLCPRLVTSNKKDFLSQFASGINGVALKFMSQEMYKREDGKVEGLYVNKISDVDLQKFGGSWENPISLQDYIDKKYEVRYTFVDGEHFVCKIESQKSKRTKVDWRRYDIANTPHMSIDAPSDIKSQIIMFMSSLGLVYGAFDFIVDHRDVWWFLEVNANGQWLWIEDLAGLPISASVAASLVKRASRERELDL